MLSFQTLMQEACVSPRIRRRPLALGGKEARRVVADAINALPETARLVLSLRYYEAIRPRQIALLLALPEEEIRQLLIAGSREVVNRLQEVPEPPARKTIHGKDEAHRQAASRRGR